MKSKQLINLYSFNTLIVAIVTSSILFSSCGEQGENEPAAKQKENSSYELSEEEFHTLIKEAKVNRCIHSSADGIHHVINSVENELHLLSNSPIIQKTKLPTLKKQNTSLRYPTQLISFSNNSRKLILLEALKETNIAYLIDAKTPETSHKFSIVLPKDSYNVPELLRPKFLCLSDDGEKLIIHATSPLRRGGRSAVFLYKLDTEKLFLFRRVSKEWVSSTPVDNITTSDYCLKKGNLPKFSDDSEDVMIEGVKVSLPK